MTSKRKLNLRVSFSTADNLCGGRSPFSLYFMLIHSTVLVSVILFLHSSGFHYRLLRLCSLYLPVAGVKKNGNENPCKEQVRHTTTIRSVNSRYEIAFLLPSYVHGFNPSATLYCLLTKTYRRVFPAITPSDD